MGVLIIFDLTDVIFISSILYDSIQLTKSCIMNLRSAIVSNAQNRLLFYKDSDKLYKILGRFFFTLILEIIEIELNMDILLGRRVIFFLNASIE